MSGAVSKEELNSSVKLLTRLNFEAKRPSVAKEAEFGEQRPFKPPHLKCLRFTANKISAGCSGGGDPETCTPVTIQVSTYLGRETRQMSGCWMKVLLDNERVVELGTTEVESGFWKKLTPGYAFNIHGRSYIITGYDSHTEKILIKEGLISTSSAGVRCMSSTDAATTNSFADRELGSFVSKNEKSSYQQPTGGNQPGSDKILGFRAFLESEKHISKDKRRDFIICYFLDDGSLEIRERFVPNSGYDPFPVFLKRQIIPNSLFREDSKGKLHKNMSITSNFDPTVDNVPESVKWYQIKVGESLQILSHRFFIYECDQVSKEFFAKVGVEQICNSEFACQSADSKNKSVKSPILPPHNGPGSAEDSMQNCLYLKPKPPKKDLIRILDNHNKYIHAVAHLYEDDDIEGSKSLVKKYKIRVHLEDDSISIYDNSNEYKSTTSSNLFLKRAQIPKPGQTDQNGQPKFYTLRDFVPGSTVLVFGKNFLIDSVEPAIVDELKLRGEVSELAAASLAKNVEESHQRLVQKNESVSEDRIRIDRQIRQFANKLRTSIGGTDDASKLSEIIEIISGNRDWIKKADMSVLVNGLNMKVDPDFIEGLSKHLQGLIVGEDSKIDSEDDHISTQSLLKLLTK